MAKLVSGQRKNVAIHVVIRRLARKKTINLVHILDSVVSKSHRASDVPLISQTPGIQGFSAYAGKATYAKRVLDRARRRF